MSAKRAPPVIPIVLALVVGLPLFALFGGAARDGVARGRASALRSVLGEETYFALLAGERTPLHYLGRNRRAPAFALPDRAGNPWSLTEHRGKVVVLNFWSVTCPPCMRELPTLEGLARIAREDWDDVEVVGICSDGSWPEVRDAVYQTLGQARMGGDFTMTTLFDPEREVIAGKFGTTLFPETWIIDRDGVIRFRYDGEQNWSSALMLEVIESFR